MDVENLIKCVKRNVCLYDIGHKDYKNSGLKAVIWDSIATELNQRCPAVIHKWKTIRDGYRKYKKQSKETSGSRRRGNDYKWSSQLQFLDNYNVMRKSRLNTITTANASAQVSPPDIPEYTPLISTKQFEESEDFSTVPICLSSPISVSDSPPPVDPQQQTSSSSEPLWCNYQEALSIQSATLHTDAYCGDVEDDDAIATMTSSDTYQLKWHSHSAHLNGSVAALLRSERFTDVVLCTMDGSQIPAHKFILSSCSVYLSSLFDGQRSVMRMSGMLYVVLPSEITTKALKILVEYMYKGETTVSNEVLDTVLKAGEVLKIRGLWRQLDEAGGDSTPAEKIVPGTTQASVNKQSIVKKPDDMQPKLTMKKDDKVIKFNQLQTQPGSRPMFIGPPKLVFIKTTEGGTQAALRPGTPLSSKGQTILVAPAPVTTQATQQQLVATVASPANTVSVATTTVSDDTTEDAPPPRVLRRHAVERKYGKKQKTEASVDGTTKEKDKEGKHNNDAGKSSPPTMEIMIKDEPEWDASSIEEEERSIAEMFQQEMSVKSEPIDEVDIDEDSLVYSPLACELCAEVFTVPAAWVRHVQGHARSDQQHARKRKHRSASDDTEETMALLRCDLCQKHFPNPAEWVRHIQSTHTETELALSNNRAPPKRHNRFTEGVQNKICTHCKKTFPSHASMQIHLRTHTGERPFVCGLCNKGFNVKSNLLRHLRTLHDQIISPAAVTDDDEPVTVTVAAPSPGPSEVKRET